MQTFSERLAAFILLFVGGLLCFALVTVHDVVATETGGAMQGNYVTAQPLIGEQFRCETEQPLQLQIVGGLELGWSLVFENAGKCHVVQLTSWDLRHW